MNQALAATLICLCCSTTFACEGLAHVQQAQQPVRTMVAAAVDEPANLRRTVAQDGPVLDRKSLYAQASVRAVPETPPAPTTDADDSSNTLLMVGLALMAGIAVRRWGAARR
ncbi:hypothetical protein JI739_11715 [Ramlibacter sp. AW1]|uniref:Uncharacterized protein n=1 Tax=Ramlibacter aurantiacus TaxID=2801330 RepID=A0A936ZPA2_9BURK|nr:hypothetical protein [Ramlibacter aurantiacus]MBL0421015.1 hypothetical protein [Ramlibacter aurantiacus]